MQYKHKLSDYENSTRRSSELDLAYVYFSFANNHIPEQQRCVLFYFFFSFFQLHSHANTSVQLWALC